MNEATFLIMFLIAIIGVIVLVIIDTTKSYKPCNPHWRCACDETVYCEQEKIAFANPDAFHRHTGHYPYPKLVEHIVCKHRCSKKCSYTVLN